MTCSLVPICFGGKSNYAVYKTAAVASDAGPCSEIGAKKLQKGGSVVDAAIATMVCEGLYNPQSAGIGGGSLISFYNATTKELIFINSRETAPLASHKNMYGGNGFSDIFSERNRLSEIGSLAIAVPGEVAGYWEAHQRYGVLPWAELFEESIELANSGIVVSKALERDIALEATYVRNPTFNLRPYFVNSDGTLKKKGQTVVRRKFAQTLRAIADEGMMGFYNGTLGRRIIDDIKDAVENEIITFEDLQQYKVNITSLINVTVGDYMLFTPGPPSSGPVLALILNILKEYNFTKNEMNGTASTKISFRIFNKAFEFTISATKITPVPTLSYHRFIEAFKFAFAHISELGDEGFNKTVTALVANMTSAEYGESIRLKINDSITKHSSFYGGDFQQVNDSVRRYNVTKNDTTSLRHPYDSCDYYDSFNEDFEIPLLNISDQGNERSNEYVTAHKEDDFQQIEDYGTSHVSVVGADGSAVSATSSINKRFGSKVVGKRTGIIFNNQMNAFSIPRVKYLGFPPSPPSGLLLSPNNFIEPGKRPMSSMVPSILLKNGNKRPTLVVGASGGAKSITGTALTILLSTWFNRPIEYAVAEKRIHHQLYPEYLQYEKQFDEKTLKGLREKKHCAEAFDPPGSVVQAIQSTGDDEDITAVCDERKGGYPGGY